MPTFSLKLINKTSQPWYYFLYQAPLLRQQLTTGNSVIEPIANSEPVSGSRSKKSAKAKHAIASIAPVIHPLVWIVSKHKMAPNTQYIFTWNDESEFFWYCQRAIKPGMNFVEKKRSEKRYLAFMKNNVMNSATTFDIVDDTPVFSPAGLGTNPGSLVISVKSGVCSETYTVGIKMWDRPTMIATAVEQQNLIFSPRYWVSASATAPHVGTVLDTTDGKDCGSNLSAPAMLIDFPINTNSATYWLMPRDRELPVWQLAS